MSSDAFEIDVRAVLAAPEKWLAEVYDVDRGEYDEDHETLQRLACFLVAEHKEREEKLFKAWQRDHPMATVEDVQRNLFFEVGGRFIALEKELDQVQEDFAELEKEVAHLRATLRAVEQTQQHQKDRIDQFAL